MGDNTGIEWCDATWSPLVGCSHVSAGCDHCYAASLASGRLSTHPIYAGIAVGGRFTGEVRLLSERLDQPLRWRKPRRIFVNSMSDLFHDAVPDEYIAQVFEVMGSCPQHIFQVLTKRPGRMASLLTRWSSGVDTYQRRDGIIDSNYRPADAALGVWPLPNVWLGTSVEDQKWANVRVPKLLATPAAVRFLSVEPMLGPVDLSEWLDPDDPDADCERCGQEWWAWMDGHPVLDEENDQTGDWCPGPMIRHSGLSWVIVGGESGPGYRPMDPAWARSLHGQCAKGRVAFYAKQDSGPRSGVQGRLPDWLWATKEYPTVGASP